MFIQASESFIRVDTGNKRIPSANVSVIVFIGGKQKLSHTLIHLGDQVCKYIHDFAAPIIIVHWFRVQMT